MTNKIRIEDVVIPEDRQRKDLGDLSGLGSSLRRVGQISPIVLRDGNVLVAGERRLSAAKLIGWTDIEFKLWSALTPVEAEIIELEENIKRSSLTWQEQCDSVLRLHAMFEDQDPDWSRTQTAEQLSMTTQHLGRLLIVAEAMAENPELRKITTLSTAYNSIQRDSDRRMADVKSDLMTMLIAPLEPVHAPAAVPQAPHVDNAPADEVRHSAPASLALSVPAAVLGTTSAAPSPKPRPSILAPEKSILQQSFIDWARTYEGPRFNFIHCDFPYAAGAGKASSQINAGGNLGSYADSADIFWELCTALLDGMTNVIAPSAHIMFWHSTAMFPEVFAYFKEREKLYDYWVQPIPLIWFKTDNTGVVADPARRPRHVYESAILISRGDRKLVQPFGDAYGAPTVRSIHPAEKPVPMLQHFFRMFVSDTTRMLDPTCGSGTSLRAAEALGAKEVLGFEIDQNFATQAQAELGSFRRKKLLADMEKTT